MIATSAKNQLMTGRDGTVEDCRRRQNGLSCRFEERDIRTCPVCEHEVDREIITARQEKDTQPPEVRYFRGFSYAAKIIGHHKKAQIFYGN